MSSTPCRAVLDFRRVEAIKKISEISCPDSTHLAPQIFAQIPQKNPTPALIEQLKPALNLLRIIALNGYVIR